MAAQAFVLALVSPLEYLRREREAASEHTAERASRPTSSRGSSARSRSETS